GQKYGFAFCGTDVDEVLADPQTHVVFIVTRHSQHASMVCRALEAGKAVFCEKPLAITPEQLAEVRAALERTGGRLMVGFNRRFAPLADELKRAVSGRGPLSVTYRVNAGPIPPDHWLSDPAEGGRIVGEACHFFDFFVYLTGSTPAELYRLSPQGVPARDDGQFLVRFEDGSVCHLIYTTTGSPGLSKERIEVHAGGASAVLEDFRLLTIDTARRVTSRLWRADKGHQQLVERWIDAVTQNVSIVDPDEFFTSTMLTLSAACAG
ncbi:MAG: Gfo/Idh/MocA family oxidoreductase, partial [Candidatus Methanomethylicaceae archaeon]